MTCERREVTEMKATLLHDEHGRILAISTDVDLKKAGSKFTKVGMVPGSGQRKLEIELSSEQEKRPLVELHKEFYVDLATLKLMRRD
jgi:hypothetical protein